MPLNANFSDARNKALPPISRVWLKRYSGPAEKAAFVNTLVQALQYDVELVYIASIELDHTDRDAAEHIAWLRAKTYSLSKQASATDIVGALGEWAVLRDIGMNESVTSVSLVSLSPESKADFLLEHVDLATGETGLIPFDIKTTASLTEPGFEYDPARHRVKGDPHILGLRLSDSWKNAAFADIFVKRADKLINVEEYERIKGGGHPSCVGSLNGNLR